MTTSKKISANVGVQKGPISYRVSCSRVLMCGKNSGSQTRPTRKKSTKGYSIFIELKEGATQTRSFQFSDFSNLFYCLVIVDPIT